MEHKYVDLDANGDSVFLYAYDANNNKINKVRQVLWGDWLQVDENHDYTLIGPGWVAVVWAPNTTNEILYIKEEHTTNERPLEIIFLDVGQGDGAVLITPERGPEEKIVVIDSGITTNMKTFLNDRFKAYRGFNFEAAIITHPDNDHYLGFKEIFDDHNIGFRTIYQNGLVERPTGSTFDKIGGVIEDPPDSGDFFVENLATSRNDIELYFNDDSGFGRYEFAPVMHSALLNPNILDYKMLSIAPEHSVHTQDRAYMPGFEPTINRNYSIEVLGPIVEYNANNEPRLKRISSDYGKFKNGHSIILRLHIGEFKVLFGGDLNIPAEKYLLHKYANLDSFPSKNSQQYQEMLLEDSKWFKAEIMKVCHHGSEKVTDEFMKVVNPACFVISSGDEEGHVHPRPDLLGRLGKFGRGESPVLLSTELQRSTREFEDQEVVNNLNEDIERLVLDHTNVELKELIKEKIKSLGRTNVDVYGAIYLKTDGKRLITAFKFEELSDKKKWFYYEYKFNENGELELC